MAGRKVTTSIFKEPVGGRVRIRRTGLVGDRQADPSVHAGPTKAVYAYPSEHYPFWRRELGQADLPWGSFGENLTTEGLDERTLRVGDRLRVGSALLEVTQPRMPCYKLGVRFGRLDMVGGSSRAAVRAFTSRSTKRAMWPRETRSNFSGRTTGSRRCRRSSTKSEGKNRADSLSSIATDVVSLTLFCWMQARLGSERIHNRFND